MSLINDALKRAREQAPEETPPSAAEDPAMTPATHATRSPQWPLVVVPALLVGVIGVAVWFFWSASNSMGLTARALTSRTVSAREEPPAESSHPAGGSNSSIAATATPAGAVIPPAVTNTAALTAPTATAPPVPKPAAPTLKLQAIFYRPAHPTAIISSKTVSRGDTIHGARVLRIDRESVALWVNGQTNVLTMP
jgi:hypothetical protein